MFSFFGERSNIRKNPGKRARRSYSLERLEDRSLLTTFTVVNLSDAGAGSFRQALLDANSTAGADVIDFSIAGTIGLKSALPTITEEVNIDGTTAPGFAGTPVIQVDFNNKAGLKFVAGSEDSALRSLSIVDASASGVKVDDANNVQIVGNFIGLALDGTTVIANRKHGLEFVSSNGNLIGGTEDEDRNVISGNKNEGIHFSNSSTNIVEGNYIGTDAAGTLARGNSHSGIILTDGSAANVIGGTTGNVVSGNKSNGVYIKGGATGNSVHGNIIGLNAAGTAVLGNALDGVKVEAANDNVIGQIDPFTGVEYYNAEDVSVAVNGWQGLRSADTNGDYLIAGSSVISGELNGLLYVGNIEATTGTAYTFLYPGSVNTSVYGPNNLDGGNVQLVGTYKNSDSATAPVEVNGFLYEGAVSNAALSNPANFRTIDFPGAKYNYVHSTAGGLVVGNHDNPVDHGSFSLPYGPGHAYIYDIDTDTFIEDIHYPGSISNSAYGIWHNGGSSYTIVGGYSTSPVDNFDDQRQPLGLAYMVDYDSSTGEFSHWTSFEYPYGVDVDTHFEGISSVEKGVYTLNAQSADAATGDLMPGSWVRVLRNDDGSFGTPDAWIDLTYIDPDTGEPVGGITTSDSVYGNQVVGINIDGSAIVSYQATIHEEFSLSNVISGNGGNGVELYGANNNTVAMNYVGTDITGTLDLGNAKNGVLITASSANNMIGGEATGGNSPTNDVFVRPPQGNLISGNGANGVLINSKSTGNQLSGNFIGTDTTGNAPLGNSLDGVSISSANGNSLIGCRFQQDPFVFYNVISGNLGNGLRVNNSNDTTIQANFFGLGADNDTGVGNALNGVLVEGSSTNTLMGGPIPLGNVTAANGQNGIAVQGKAGSFVSYNTFSGVAAFSSNTTLGNHEDGILITATGGNILVRTCVISENFDDGVEISGKAKGVQISEDIIGLNWDGSSGMGNGDNGIEVGGSASNILLGGELEVPSVSPRNAIGGNLGNGVAILGSAKNTVVNHSYIGTDISGQVGVGNSLSGVYIGAGTSGTTVGSTEFSLQTLISDNGGDGVEMQSTSGNTVIGCYIGTDTTGTTDLGNGANGIYLNNSSKNTIGGSEVAQGNLIVFNHNDGVYVQSGTRNGIIQNSIYGNGPFGIELGAGANNNQVAPVLTSADSTSGDLEVSGTLTSKAKTTYILEFFASDLDDASGRYFLGSLTVTTNSSGVAAFTASLLTPPIGSDFITATATDPSNNTSAFSAAISLVI